MTSVPQALVHAAKRDTGQRLLFNDRLGFAGRIASTELPESPMPADQFEDGEMVKLLNAVVLAIEARPLANPEKWVRRERATDLRFEMSFADVVQRCLAAGAFPWLMVGRWADVGDERRFDLCQRCKSALGKILAERYSGREIQIDDGRMVRLSYRGRARHRRYRFFLQG